MLADQAATPNLSSECKRTGCISYYGIDIYRVGRLQYNRYSIDSYSLRIDNTGGKLLA
ncbi:MAG: hypothetical protein LUD02_14155 [Tannerellaceae bacterium]|nr:hypothetical protein [Tannerellaceae bacterium]MCD8265145.1 hypothetical protein [Tannerellaceae bacterium]